MSEADLIQELRFHANGWEAEDAMAAREGTQEAAILRRAADALAAERERREKAEALLKMADRFVSASEQNAERLKRYGFTHHGTRHHSDPWDKHIDTEGESERPFWYLSKDGDLSCLALYERHYSCHRYADGRRRSQFVGPGENIVLRTGDADALFVWRKFIDDSGQTGVNCAVFRNESKHRSSLLIRQADAIADHVWPDSRHYTFVNPKAVRSSNPGFCFVAAGWRKCGMTKGGLIILERITAGDGEDV